MDVFAHALWAGIGIAAISRTRPIETRTVVATVGLAALPDLVRPLPLMGWWLFGEGSASTLWAYALALPGQEPAMPPMVAMLTHHIHCNSPFNDSRERPQMIHEFLFGSKFVQVSISLIATESS
jgi:hypothetical protein